MCVVCCVLYIGRLCCSLFADRCSLCGVGCLWLFLGSWFVVLGFWFLVLGCLVLVLCSVFCSLSVWLVGVNSSLLAVRWYVNYALLCVC